MGAEELRDIASENDDLCFRVDAEPPDDIRHTLLKIHAQRLMFESGLWRVTSNMVPFWESSDRDILGGPGRLLQTLKAPPEQSLQAR